MVEEGEVNTGVASRIKGYLKEMPFFCKVVELILCVISIGLIVDPFNNQMQSNPNHAAIVYVSLCGYVIINSVLILCYLLGERLTKRTSMIFSALGAILCCVAGIVLIHDWSTYQDNMISRYLQQYLDQMVSSGVFAILASAVFVLDVYFTNKNE